DDGSDRREDAEEESEREKIARERERHRQQRPNTRTEERHESGSRCDEYGLQRPAQLLLPKSRSRAPEQGRKPVVHGIPDEYEDRYVRATSALGERSEGLRVVSRVRPAHQYPTGGQQHRPKQLAQKEGRERRRRSTSLRPRR